MGSSEAWNSQAAFSRVAGMQQVISYDEALLRRPVRSHSHEDPWQPPLVPPTPPPPQRSPPVQPSPSREPVNPLAPRHQPQTSQHLHRPAWRGLSRCNSSCSDNSRLSRSHRARILTRAGRTLAPALGGERWQASGSAELPQQSGQSSTEVQCGYHVRPGIRVVLSL